ncbi:MAG TPA: hypothetical protein VLG40_00395 [Candidatus Saccharimonas sp.]|nr:hypothetical protein [Candidatus Saccharimonas sp.]
MQECLAPTIGDGVQILRFKFPADGEITFADWKKFLLHVGLGSSIPSAAALCGLSPGGTREISRQIRTGFNVENVHTAVALAAGKRIITPPETEVVKWSTLRFDAIKVHHAAILILAASGCNTEEVCHILAGYTAMPATRLLADTYTRLGVNGSTHRAKGFARWFWGGPAELAQPLHALSRIELRLLARKVRGDSNAKAGQNCSPRLSEYGVQWFLANAQHKAGVGSMRDLITYARINKLLA